MTRSVRVNISLLHYLLDRIETQNHVTAEELKEAGADTEEVVHGTTGSAEAQEGEWVVH